MPLLFPSFSRFVPHGLAVLLAMALAGCERPAPQAAAATPGRARRVLPTWARPMHRSPAGRSPVPRN